MRYLLNLAYVLLLSGAFPWLAYAAWKHGKYRQGLPEKLWGKVPLLSPHSGRIWFHAVSVGEVNLISPIVEQLLATEPTVEIVLSTTTNSGYELAQKRYPHLSVFFAPLDFSWAMREAFRRIDPRMLVLVELELWPNQLAEARKRSVPVVIVNGRLGEASFRGYRRVSFLWRRWLRDIRLVAAQSSSSADRFRSLGVPANRIHLVGSVKFDGASRLRNDPKTEALVRLARYENDEIVFLAGSTQPGEERLAWEVYQALAKDFPQLRLILVPRHPERFDDVAAMLRAEETPFLRRTQLTFETESPKVLLVDTVGELGAWWGRAQIGFVGGSLGGSRGGQNMIEPAALGVATCFGPSTRNFRDIVELLLQSNAAVVVHDLAEMTEFVRRCLRDPAYRTQLGSAGQALVETQRGATDRTITLLRDVLHESPSRN